jgi:urease accessory protein UreF
MIANQTSWLSGSAEVLLGDFHSLGEQIGSPEGLLSLGGVSSSLAVAGMKNPARLKSYLEFYQHEILFPVELPAIHQACSLAAQNQARELLALDQQMERHPKLQPFAAASRRVGQAHLLRLAPLRDHRLVQRYVHALEAGEVCAWHTLVYGMVLAIYSLPLRQGLIHYAQQTLSGFVQAAAMSHRLPGPVCKELLDPIIAELPQAVERELGEHGTPSLKCC